MRLWIQSTNETHLLHILILLSIKLLYTWHYLKRKKKQYLSSNCANLLPSPLTNRVSCILPSLCHWLLSMWSFTAVVFGRSYWLMWRRGWARTWLSAALTLSTPMSSPLRDTWWVIVIVNISRRTNDSTFIMLVCTIHSSIVSNWNRKSTVAEVSQSFL